MSRSISRPVRQALGSNKLDFYGASYPAVDAQAYAGSLSDTCVGRASTHRSRCRLRSLLRVFPAGRSRARFAWSAAIRALLRGPPRRSDELASLASDCDGTQSTEWVTTRMETRIPCTHGGLPRQIVFMTRAFAPAARSQPRPARFARRPHTALRLAAEKTSRSSSRVQRSTLLSVGDSFARSCTDLRFPWNQQRADRAAPRAMGRRGERPGERRLRAFLGERLVGTPSPRPLPRPPCNRVAGTKSPGSSPPFPRDETSRMSPALVLSGDLDAGTTTADAKRVARLFPGSRVRRESRIPGHHTAATHGSTAPSRSSFSSWASSQPATQAVASSNEFRLPRLGRSPKRRARRGGE